MMEKEYIPEIPGHILAFLESDNMSHVVTSGLAPCFLRVICLYLKAQADGDSLTAAVLRDNYELGMKMWRHFKGDKEAFQSIAEGIEKMSKLNLETLGKWNQPSRKSPHE